MDLVPVPKEGKYDRCKQCGMQVNPLYPHHRFLKECQVGVEQKKQREVAVRLALALWQQLSINKDVLKLVKVFKYLGRLLAQDDDDIQAICAHYGRLAPLGLKLDRSFREKMIHHMLPPHSTKQQYRPFSYMAVKLGFFPEPL
jgi:hypothetical protein